jgi:hypothetical protein
MERTIKARFSEGIIERTFGEVRNGRRKGAHCDY